MIDNFRPHRLLLDFDLVFGQGDSGEVGGDTMKARRHVLARFRGNKMRVEVMLQREGGVPVDWGGETKCGWRLSCCSVKVEVCRSTGEGLYYQNRSAGRNGRGSVCREKN